MSNLAAEAAERAADCVLLMHTRAESEERPACLDDLKRELRQQVMPAVSGRDVVVFAANASPRVRALIAKLPAVQEAVETARASLSVAFSDELLALLGLVDALTRVAALEQGRDQADVLRDAVEAMTRRGTDG